MGTTAWSTLRQEIMRPLGLETGTATTNLSPSNTSIIDTLLTRKYPSDDYFNDAWY